MSPIRLIIMIFFQVLQNMNYYVSPNQVPLPNSTFESVKNNIEPPQPSRMVSLAVKVKVATMTHFCTFGTVTPVLIIGLADF